MKSYVAVTGTSWLGRGIPAVGSVLRSLIRSADEEIQWSIYSVTREAIDLFDLMEKKLQQGVRVTVVVNRLKNQPAVIQQRIMGMASNYKHFEAFDFTPSDEYAQMHAKLLIVDRRKALIGSANVSRGGLLRNHEIGVVVDDDLAGQLAVVFDRLMRPSRTMSRIKP